MPVSAPLLPLPLPYRRRRKIRTSGIAGQSLELSIRNVNNSLFIDKYKGNNRIVHVHRRKKWPLSSCLYSHTEQEEHGLDLTYFSNVMMKHRDGQM